MKVKALQLHAHSANRNKGRLFSGMAGATVGQLSAQTSAVTCNLMHHTSLCYADWVETTKNGSCGAEGWRCKPSAPIQGVFGCIIALAMAWFILWLFLIYRGKRHLYGLPYADHKVANLFLRLQVGHSVHVTCMYLLSWHSDEPGPDPFRS